jgi:hypothetical protein
VGGMGRAAGGVEADAVEAVGRRAGAEGMGLPAGVRGARRRRGPPARGGLASPPASCEAGGGAARDEVPAGARRLASDCLWLKQRALTARPSLPRAARSPTQGKVVEFAEKPKGDALKSMRVDTTVLGVDAET